LATLTETKPLAVPDTLNSAQTEDRLFKRVFLSPAVAILLLLSIFPLFWSLGVSFTDIQRNAAQQAQARQQENAGESVERSGVLGLGFNVTLDNYARIPTDTRLLTTARNTLLYVLGGVTIQYVIGFGLALLLNQEFVGRRFFRLVFLLPMMLTPIAAAYVGRMMFDSNISPLAQFLRTLGTFATNLTGQETRLVVPWLTDTGWAPLTIMLIDCWQWIPFMTLLLLAGMQGIPDEIYEAARVDGASSWAIFSRITFPLLLPISFTAILIRGLEIFKIVDIVRVATGGGPGVSTESIVMYVFETALNFGNYGYAAAISYVLLVMVIAFSTFFLYLSRRFTTRALGE
jgi:multiple sugar transport system permease protein